MIKIYNSGNAIVLENAQADGSYITIAASGFSYDLTDNGIFTVNDSVKSKTYELGSYDQFADAGGVAFVSEDAAKTHLNTLFLKRAGGADGQTFTALKVGTDPNLFEVEADGTPVQRGTATVWDDIVGSLVGRLLSSTAGKIDYNWDENSITMQPGGNPANTADRLIFSYQYPHAGVKTDAEKGTQAAQYLHIHWEQTSTDRIEWQVDYRIQHNGQAKTTAWTTVTANSVDNSAFTYVSGTLNQITSLVTVNIPEPSLSATVQYRLTRIDNTASNVDTTFVDAHIEMDMNGSHEPFVK